MNLVTIVIRLSFTCIKKDHYRNFFHPHHLAIAAIMIKVMAWCSHFVRGDGLASDFGRNQEIFT